MKSRIGVKSGKRFFQIDQFQGNPSPRNALALASKNRRRWNAAPRSLRTTRLCRVPPSILHRRWGSGHSNGFSLGLRRFGHRIPRARTLAAAHQLENCNGLTRSGDLGTGIHRGFLLVMVINRPILPPPGTAPGPWGPGPAPRPVPTRLAGLHRRLGDRCRPVGPVSTDGSGSRHCPGEEAGLHRGKPAPGTAPAGRPPPTAPGPLAPRQAGPRSRGLCSRHRPRTCAPGLDHGSALPSTGPPGLHRGSAPGRPAGRASQAVRRGSAGHTGRRFGAGRRRGHAAGPSLTRWPIPDLKPSPIHRHHRQVRGMCHRRSELLHHR
jgi:hypothetical protein